MCYFLSRQRNRNANEEEKQEEKNEGKRNHYIWEWQTPNLAVVYHQMQSYINSYTFNFTYSWPCVNFLSWQISTFNAIRSICCTVKCWHNTVDTHPYERFGHFEFSWGNEIHRHHLVALALLGIEKQCVLFNNQTITFQAEIKVTVFWLFTKPCKHQQANDNVASKFDLWCLRNAFVHFKRKLKLHRANILLWSIQCFRLKSGTQFCATAILCWINALLYYANRLKYDFLFQSVSFVNEWHKHFA